MDAATSFSFNQFSPTTRAELAKGMAAATPFPHVVLDDVITAPAEPLLDAFPGADWPDWDALDDAYQKNKWTCSDISRIPEPLAALIHELNEPAFLSFLEELSGISDLLPDPYLVGGGLHASGSGGHLTPHTDFHIHPKLPLYRRLNLLLYLNPAWHADDGGSLELYADGTDQAVRSVVPTYGRCVIFRTDHHSIHGFPTPVAEGHRRNSIALYYYTAQETEVFSGSTVTFWRQYGNQEGAAATSRLAMFRALRFGSRSLSWAAHRVDPNRRRTDSFDDPA